MNIKIVKINDETLSQPKYSIFINGEFYAGNITRKGLDFWTNKLFKSELTVRTI